MFGEFRYVEAVLDRERPSSLLSLRSTEVLGMCMWLEAILGEEEPSSLLSLRSTEVLGLIHAAAGIIVKVGKESSSLLFLRYTPEVWGGYIWAHY